MKWAEKHAGGVVVAVIAVVIGVYALGESLSGDGRTDERVRAYELAEGKVLDLLKAPSTAEFPDNKRAHVATTRGGDYRIESWVDSENGFGAELRTEWTAVIETGNGSFYVKSLSLE